MRSRNAFNDSLGAEDERWQATLSTTALHGPQAAHRNFGSRPIGRDIPHHNTPKTCVQTATMARKSVTDASAAASSTTDFIMTISRFVL
jgi:hypothetical protein